MTQQLLSVQKHLSLNIKVTVSAPNFLAINVLEPDIFTDTSCHKTGTSLLHSASFFLRLSLVPHPASFKVMKTK